MAQTTGALSLPHLLKSMSPVLHPSTFVWGTIPTDPSSSSTTILNLFAGNQVQMLFREQEGWTVLVPEEVAKEIQLQSTFPCRMVTLNVHSSLEAVGFIAAISARLTKLGLGVNPVSGYYHDHLFVAPERAEEVVEELRKMAGEQEEA